jgi:hypothetical protein
MKKSKRKKISFNSVNEGKMEIIDPKKIAETNARIKESMRKFKMVG